MIRIKNTTTFIILFSILIILSCSTDNSITGSNDNALFKPNSGGSDIDTIDYSKLDSFDKCVIAWTFGPAFLFLGPPSPSALSNDEAIEISYDFRDNYLDKSDKGQFYKLAYYHLSEYSIKNNLINEYFTEHRDLMVKGIPKAYDLHYNTNKNKILIDEKLSNKMKEMLKIYRNHPNHREIDDVLDYLEKDLVKYENQPKSVIAKDFK